MPWSQTTPTGRIVVSLDRKCLDGENAALRPQNHVEAFSIRRLEGSCWCLRRTAMGFEWRCDRKAERRTRTKEQKSTHTTAGAEKAAEKSVSRDRQTGHD